MELWLFLYIIIGLFVLAYKLNKDFTQKTAGVSWIYRILVMFFMVSFWWVFVIALIRNKIESRKEKV